MKNFFLRLFTGSKKSSKTRPPVRLALEPFEARDLPNASPFLAAFQHLAFDNPGHLGALNAGLGDPASQGQCQGLGLGQSQDQRQTLVANLTGTTGASGTVFFRSNSTTGDNSLTVQVSGLTADSTYTVMSGTTKLGTINTNAKGAGYFSVSNVSPALTSGATITVQDSTSATVLSGTLATFTPPTLMYLSASLTGTTAGAAGAAQYASNSTSGDSSLRVQVAGLTADSTYTVQIGGTTVGTINTDASGRGWLSLSNPSATVSSGSVLTVLDSSQATVLQGTFAADTAYVGWGHHR
jgi:hypothetical protein